MMFIFMLILFNYTLRQLVAVTVLVAVALCGVVWLTQSLRFVDYVVNRGVGIGLFLQFVALLIPNILVIVLPLGLFIAVLVTYNRLAGDSELTVMRAAGLSPLWLARPALALAGVVSVIGYVQSLWLLPVSYTAFKDLQYDIRQNYATALIQEGAFTPIEPGLTLYVGRRTSSGLLEDLMLHDVRTPERPVTVLARQGAVTRTSAGVRLVVLDGERQEMNAREGRLTTLYFDRYALDIGMLAAPSGPRGRERQEYFVPEMLHPGPDVPPDDYARLRATAHGRLLTPLYALTLTLIALVAVLGGSHSRHGQGGRLRLAVLAAAVVQGGAIGAETLAARQPNLLPLMYLNISVPAALALWALAQPMVRCGIFRRSLRREALT
jgi:lipopolysaccharide export system permease protein